jgi:hypothetical protein
MAADDARGGGSVLKLPALPGFKDVLVFADDSSATTFYALPAVPRIRSDQDGRPMLLFLKYRGGIPFEGEALGGGLLAFQTELSLRPAEREAVTTALSQPGGAAHGKGSVQLATPTFVDGSVDLLTFTPAAGGLVEAIAGSAKPSLSTDLTAVFNIQLSRDGATILWEQLRAKPSPVGIRYSLTFMARLPAGRARVFLRAGGLRDAWPTVSKLPPGPERQKALAGHDAAGVEILDWPIDEPSLDALRERLVTWGWGILDQATGGALAAPPPPGSDGGASPPAVQDLDMVVDGRSAIEWTINPQGNLGSIADEVAEAAFRELDLSDPIFKLIRVETRANADFERDQIAAVSVALSHGTKRHDVVLTDSSSVDTWEVVAEPGLELTYAFQPMVKFRGTSRTVDLPGGTSADRHLVINVGSVGWVRLEVTTVTGWQSVGEVQVTLSYEDLARDVPHESAVLSLTAARPSAKYERAVWTVVDRPVTCQVTYVTTDGRRVEQPPFDHPGAFLVVPDLFEDSLTVRLLAAGGFDDVRVHAVECRYDDGAGRTESKTLSLTASQPDATWVVPIEAGKTRDFEYRVTTTFADGHAESSDWMEGTGGTVVVGGAPGGLLEVHVAPDLLDFSAIKLAIVRLRHTGTTAPEPEQRSLTFLPGASGETWRIPLAAGESGTFDWSVEYILADGSHRAMPSVSSTDPTIVIPPLPA